MRPYAVFSDGEFECDHAGLCSALADARTEAQRDPGVLFTVRRGDTLVGSYVVHGGVLKAWVR